MPTTAAGRPRSASRSGGPEFGHVLLRDPEWLVRHKAAVALSEIGACRTELRQACQDEHPSVARAAREALEGS